MNHGKRPERRTFLQDRFEILIKRQQSGEATFNELTELDEIVNRDPVIRDRIIRESMLLERMDEFNEPSGRLEDEQNSYLPQVHRRTLINRLKSLIARIFTSEISIVRIGGVPSYAN